MLGKIRLYYYAILFLCVTIIPSAVGARGPVDLSDKSFTPAIQLSDAPAYGAVGHRIGRMVLCICNNGSFGTGFATSGADFFTDEMIPSCEYPKGSNTRYLYAGAFWIGAIVGRDTLVSMAATGWSWGREFSPDIEGIGEIRKKSISGSDPSLLEGAVSEEDYIMVYYDTLTANVDNDWSGRPHVPLNIEVTQRSYAWSYSYAEDFVLFDYTVRNIGRTRLEDVYMGIYVDADVYFGQSSSSGGYRDDICGFVEAFPRYYGGCQYWDTVNIAWIADNDGDPEGGIYTELSVPHVTGTRIVRTPSDELDVSFNWWISNSSSVLDFGPRERPLTGRWEEEFRDFGTGGLGTPMGDANSYYQMRNREFDYDQIYTSSISANDPIWLLPSAELAGDFADGFDTRYLLSFGPFDIDPGERLPLSFAYVAGQDFHQNPANINYLPGQPASFYDNINFDDMALNAAWAGRIYDNPGIDTDGDGYEGKVRLCCDDSLAYSLENIADTIEIEDFNASDCEFIWYEGDGVPDFRGASPPPGPEFWLEPSVGSIHVRINGFRSETTRDVFSRICDFEGYRVYVGLDERESSYSLVASYDREDYNKYVWTGDEYRLLDIPYSIDSLRCLYGASCEDQLFDPMLYSRDNPYTHPLFPDSVFYFVPQDFNVSGEGTGVSLVKTYPNQTYPSSLNPDSANPDELTEDGYFKYFEYEITLDNLLPTISYWVNVTAFDFGSPKAELQSLESAVTLGGKCAYPDRTAGDVLTHDLKVYVYPNPYRGDANYRDAGFEGRTDSDRPNDRVRAINFANLPPKCTIRIYSLDGDLIRELDHDVPVDDPTASHETWNMITRNTQMITSGLYYWTVETPGGETQIGKLVVIM